MPATYEPIATTTFSGSENTVTFSSIPSTYTDLRVVFSGAITGSDNTLYTRFNGDASTNYSQIALIGTGATAASNEGGPNEVLIGAGTITSSYSLITLDIFSYSGSTFKTVLTSSSGDKNGSGLVDRKVALWRSTSAINSIRFYTSGSINYTSGSTITIYGIKAA